MKISKIIKERGFTIQQVADGIGLSRGTVARNIGGDNPTVQTLRSIAEVIGCKMADFFEDERTQEPIMDERKRVGGVCPVCGARLRVNLSKEHEDE